MNETDEPYRENPAEPVENLTTEPARFPHANRQRYANKSKKTRNVCATCNQEFSTKQELTMHYRNGSFQSEEETIKQMIKWKFLKSPTNYLELNFKTGSADKIFLSRIKLLPLKS